MARAIYTLKMCLLQSQLKMAKEEIQALCDVCLFITTIYVKSWLQCSLGVKAPFQDICLLKTLKSYEKVDATISEAALKKFCQHLWYLNDEIVMLSIFDDSVDDETKTRIVANLDKQSTYGPHKRYIPSKEEMSSTLYGTFTSTYLTTVIINLNNEFTLILQFF